MDQMARIRATVQPELGWDEVRWQAEEKSYDELWRTSYRLG
jgi:glycerol-3-phosphate dehydrogenase